MMLPKIVIDVGGAICPALPTATKHSGRRSDFVHEICSPELHIDTLKIKSRHFQ
jgi:hypothetical protein